MVKIWRGKIYCGSRVHLDGNKRDDFRLQQIELKPIYFLLHLYL